MSLHEILLSWISNPLSITSDDSSYEYLPQHEQKKAFKKLPNHIAYPLKCFFDFAYYHASSNIKNHPIKSFRALKATLMFLQNWETIEDLDKIFEVINNEILHYIKQPQTIEDYLGWWIVVFLYDKFPSYKHSEELDELLWNNLEKALRSQITPNKAYLIEWLQNIARYDSNDPKNLRMKKIFLQLAFDWIIFQPKDSSQKNNDDVLEVLSAVNNIPLNFENSSDNRQFDDLKQKFAQLNFEYSVGDQKKIIFYKFMKKNVNSIHDLFFESLITLRSDERSGITYSIWKGKIKSTGAKVVVKCFSSRSREDLKRFEKEGRFLKKLSMMDDFFLQFYTAFHDVYINKPDEVAYYIVMQFCKHSLGKEINDLIERGQIYGKFIASDIYKLLKGFCELSSLNIYHYDIKPDTIFIDEDGNHKLGDFGLSYEFDDSNVETNAVQGDIDYMSPELREVYGDRSFKSKKIYFPREKSDVFSLGLVFLKMATLKPISGLNAKWSKVKLKERIFSIEQQWLSRLLFKMLEFDFRKRLSFNEAFDMLAKDEDFLAEEIENNTITKTSSQLSIYFTKRIKEKCENLDINDDSIVNLLKFICPLDKCKVGNDLLKEFALQKICQYLSECIKEMPERKRKNLRGKLTEIIKLITLNCENGAIFQKIQSLIGAYLGDLKSVSTDHFTSDVILGHQCEFSNYKTSERIYHFPSPSDLMNEPDYSGDIKDINQVDLDTCEMCITDALSCIKIERWRGYAKADIMNGVAGLNNTRLAVKIYSYQSFEDHNITASKENKEEKSNLAASTNKWKNMIENEAITMKFLSGKQKNFLKYYGAFYRTFENMTKFYIITEDWNYLLSKEINHLYNSKKKYDSWMMSLIVWELMKSIVFMRNNRIFHHGLSTSAFAVPSKGYHFKIVDFHFSFQSEATEESSYNTNEEFYAPEQILAEKKKWREQSGVFSLGLVFLSIAISEPICGLNRDEEAVCKAISKVEKPWMARLLSHILNYNYKQRLGFKELIDQLKTDEEFINDLWRSKRIKNLEKKQPLAKKLLSIHLINNQLLWQPIIKKLPDWA